MIDLVILVASISLAIWLSDSKVLEHILVASKESKFIGSLVGGLFFTSIFTTAPAIVMLGEISQHTSVWYVGFVGAIGAVIGDILMFEFLKDRLAKDFYALFHIDPTKRYFRLPKFRWLVFLIGGFVIASPFPDELGLAILGFSETKTKYVMVLSFVFNFVGILAIAAIMR